MDMHRLYFLMHGDLAQAKEAFQAWQEKAGPESEANLYEGFILQNRDYFDQLINAQIVPQAASGVGLGTTEVCNIIKGFSNDNHIVVVKYSLTFEIGEGLKIVEINPSAEEKANYLKELVKQALGTNGSLF